MNLTTKDITKDKALTQKAKALYLRAFPREERLPWWILCLNSRRKDIDLTAFLDGDTFCGFTASVTVEGMHFLLFLAIDDDLRGTGCGTAILHKLRQEHPCIALNVEIWDPQAPNFAQRQQRFHFYGKNGFFDTGWHVWEVGGMFRVLATRRELDIDAYRRVFRRISFNFWRVCLEKACDLPRELI